MHPDIKCLLELQSVDARIAELRRRLEEFPRRLAETDKRVADARQQLTSAKEALTSSLKDRKTYEMDVESWKEKARKYREQSFAVKTNEAYKALQHEIQHAEGEMARAEDRLLERMVAGEDFDRQAKSAERDIATVERATDVERASIRAEQSALQHELEERESERKGFAAAVPESLLAEYERIANRRHGIGMAAVRDEACTLCGVRIRPHVFQELRRPDQNQIFQCETCARILYYVEPPPSEQVNAPASGVPANEG